MARPQKVGLEYFPLDVDIDSDDKVAIIEAQHGMIGFAIVIKLLMKIYADGYFYKWREREQLLFSSRINVDINKVKEVVNDCVKWGLFDEKLYEKHKVLTSKGIQRRYLEATKRRQMVEIDLNYLLLEKSEISAYSNLVIEGVNVYINSDDEIVDDDINTDNKEDNDDINPQSKVKKSKVKKSIYAEFVKMTENEHQKLIERYGESNTKKMIETLDNYKGSTGKKYKSDYRAILSWVADKVLGEAAKNQTNPFREKAYQPLREVF